MERRWWTTVPLQPCSSNSPGAKEACMDEEGFCGISRSLIGGPWQKADERRGTDGPIQTYWWECFSLVTFQMFSLWPYSNFHWLFPSFILLHTGEFFHSPLIKYLPKWQAFLCMGMRERADLTILEHNENIIKSKQATTKIGMLWCVVKVSQFLLFFQYSLFSQSLDKYFYWLI